jgi:hypothetical protein
MSYRKAKNLNQPKNQKAVQEANKEVPVANTPELRKQWMDAYIAAGGEYKDINPSGRTPSNIKQPCLGSSISSIKIISIKFKSDHGVLKNYDADWDDGGVLYSELEWTPSNQYPVSHTMDSNIEIEVTIQVEPNNACPETGSLVGEGPGGMKFEKSNFKFTPGKHTFSLTSTQKLEKKVQELNFSIQWKVEGISVSASPIQTQNTMFVTMGTPHGSGVTKKRMAWVVNRCRGKSKPHDCVKEIHDSTGSYDLSAGTPTPFWKIAGGAHAQCMDLSQFYKLASEMLGLSGGNVVYLYPKVGKTTKEFFNGRDNEKRLITSSKPPHPNPTTHDDFYSQEKIALIDGSGGWNNYEACYKFDSKYYAGGADIYNTAQEVMEAVCQRTEWTYQTSYFGWSICTTPGPSPIERWY